MVSKLAIFVDGEFVDFIVVELSENIIRAVQTKVLDFYFPGQVIDSWEYQRVSFDTVRYVESEDRFYTKGELEQVARNLTVQKNLRQRDCRTLGEYIAHFEKYGIDVYYTAATDKKTIGIIETIEGEQLFVPLVRNGKMLKG